MKTKVEIIEETAEFYNSQNRAANVAGCFYLMYDGSDRKCAVGRCMTESAIVLHGDTGGGVNHLLDKLVEIERQKCQDDATPIDYTKLLNTILKEEYQGHDVSFWATLQQFHDRKKYWTETGLSEEGMIVKDNLINQYTNEN
jgi:hypothetical protein